MRRLDVYTAVHKMQRARLFELTVEAGKTDPTDPVAGGRIAAAVDALAAELIAHGEHEERFIHPVLRAHAPDLADALDAAHIRLDASLDRLRQVASADTATPGDPNALYRALAEFTATYLEHLATEESEALPSLWQCCSDEELMAILVSFKSSRSDTENLTSLLAQLATLNPPEIVTMATKGLAISASEIAELLAIVLDPYQQGALHLALSADTVTA